MANMSVWLKNTYEVTQIQGGDRFNLNFNGMSLAVQLVSLDLTDEAKAKALLKEKILNKKVTVIPESAAGTSSDGLQLVYCIVNDDGKKLLINETLLKKGFASYKKVGSEKFAKLQTKMAGAAQAQPTASKLASSSSSKGATFSKDIKTVSELYSKKYHLKTCRWAKLINPQSLIVYENYSVAEKANKFPCSNCCYERVKEKRVELAASKKTKSKSASGSSSKKLTGSLFAVEGAKYFYSPVSKKLAKLGADQVLAFSSVKEAKAAKFRADPGSLRIDNPVVPGPTGSECIGRALPYLRPCRRDASHSTGLCDPCLNGSIR